MRVVWRWLRPALVVVTLLGGLPAAAWGPPLAAQSTAAPSTRPSHAALGSLWTASRPSRLDVVTLPVTATVSQRVTAKVFQGVRNGMAAQGGALVWLDQGEGAYEDTYWPPLYARTYGVVTQTVSFTAALATAALAVTSTEAITRYVIWDPALPATINVASTIAGVDHVLAIDPADETGGLNLKGLGYHLFIDLRGMFHSRDEAYTWALANLAASSDPRAIAIQGVGDHGEDGPASGARDYAVAARLFQFSVPPADPLYGRIIAAFPLETIVLGFDPTDQKGFTYQDSLRGDVGINTALVRNLSCHSAFTPALIRPPQPDPETVRLDPTKVYLAFSISDGDAVGLQSRFYNNRGDPTYTGLWRDVARGRIPLGWGISPVMAQLQRGVLAQLYAERSLNDYFVSWLPGGYYNYHALPLQAKHDVLAWNRAIMDDAGLRVGWTYDHDRVGTPVFSAAEAAAYADAIPSLGWIQGYHDDEAYLDPERYHDPLYEGGQPRPFLFNAVDARGDEPEYTEFKINRLADLTTQRPLFLPVNFVIWHVHTLGDLLRVWRDLQAQRPGRYALVTPGQLMALQDRYLRHGGVRAYQPVLNPGDSVIGRAEGDGWAAATTDGAGLLATGPSWSSLAPGAKVAAFRLQIGNNTADDDLVATLSVVDRSSATVLGTLPVYRHDFTTARAVGSAVTAGPYQDFLAPFHLRAKYNQLDLRVAVTGRAYLKLQKVLVHSAQFWRGADPTLRHDVGRALPEGGGWTAAPPQDPVVGYLSRVSGTRAIPQGVHLASWSLAVDDNALGNDVVATIAVYDRDTHSVLAARDLRRQEFAFANRQQEFTMQFINQAGHRLDLRTYYWAHAGLTQAHLIVRD